MGRRTDGGAAKNSGDGHRPLSRRHDPRSPAAKSDPLVSPAWTRLALAASRATLIAIWVSEIMLQQTTVAAVVPYYERFLARFPTVQALARAREHDVLRLWEGLGYYSRARNLRLAAQQIVSERNGTIPQEPGRFSPSCPASAATRRVRSRRWHYDRPAPIVEANTLRVYARLLAFGGDVHSTGGRNVIWNFAERAVPRRSAGAFNQALMDLGATICTPAEPALRTVSRAIVLPGVSRRSCARGSPAACPSANHLRRSRRWLPCGEDGRYLLRRSPPGERWAGLWEFLRIGLGEDSPGSNGNGSPHEEEFRHRGRFRQQRGGDWSRPWPSDVV